MGGEHLHTLSVEGSHMQLSQVNWLSETAVSACAGSEVTVWSISQEQYQETGTFAANPTANITYLAASPSGQYIAGACDNGMVSHLALVVIAEAGSASARGFATAEALSQL